MERITDFGVERELTDAELELMRHSETCDIEKMPEWVFKQMVRRSQVRASESKVSRNAEYALEEEVSELSEARRKASDSRREVIAKANSEYQAEVSRCSQEVAKAAMVRRAVVSVADKEWRDAISAYNKAASMLREVRRARIRGEKESE